MLLIVAEVILYIGIKPVLEAKIIIQINELFFLEQSNSVFILIKNLKQQNIICL